MSKNSIEKQNYSTMLFDKGGGNRPLNENNVIKTAPVSCPYVPIVESCKKDRTNVVFPRIQNQAVVKAETAANSPAKIAAKAKIVKNFFTPHITGKIEHFEQGNIGDCWELTGTEALANTTEGAKIIKNSISQNKKGNVTVTLGNAGESYTFTPKQIIDAKFRLSTGDDNARVLELAMEQHRLGQIKDGYNMLEENKMWQLDPDSPLTSGCLTETISALTPTISLFAGTKAFGINALRDPNNNGHTTSWIEQFSQQKNIADNLKSVQENPKTFAATAAFLYNKKPMYSGHAYTVKSVDDYYVTLINPWYTSKEKKVLKSDFIQNCNEIILSLPYNYQQ